MEADIIITIALAITVMVAITQIARIVRAFSIQRTIREALMHGSVLTPELLASMEETVAPRRGGDDRKGIILIAIALALIGFGALAPAENSLRALTGVSLFPMFVGIALLGRYWLNRRRGGDA